MRPKSSSTSRWDLFATSHLQVDKLPLKEEDMSCDGVQVVDSHSVTVAVKP